MKKAVLFVLLALLMPMVSDAKKAQVRYATFNIRTFSQSDNEAGYGWSVRRDRIADYILEKGLDIVGTQETLFGAINDLLNRLPGYDYIAAGRDDGKQEGETMALFYKKDKYELLDSGHFWLSETPDVPSKGWDGAYPRMATWGKFKDRKSGKVFMGVNTHFDHIGTEARRQGALLIIQKIKEIVGKKPAIITGDFNVDDKSEAYQTITTNEFILKDAYKISPDHEGCNYTYQGFAKIQPVDAPKIDFIFLTPKIQVKHTCITPTSVSYIMSDHNPHWADIQF